MNIHLVDHLSTEYSLHYDNTKCFDAKLYEGRRRHGDLVVGLCKKWWLYNDDVWERDQDGIKVKRKNKPTEVVGRMTVTTPLKNYKRFKNHKEFGEVIRLLFNSLKHSSLLMKNYYKSTEQM